MSTNENYSVKRAKLPRKLKKKNKKEGKVVFDITYTRISFAREITVNLGFNK